MAYLVDSMLRDTAGFGAFLTGFNKEDAWCDFVSANGGKEKMIYVSHGMIEDYRQRRDVKNYDKLKTVVY